MSYSKVVIIGGGFGGLNCALKLKRADANVYLFDRNNHHTFQPLLYQVATAALSPENVAVPIREILKSHKNTTVYLANIDKIDKENKLVVATGGEEFEYDYLVVATGARHSYFGHPEWEEFAPGLKSLTDALHIREKILLAFEIAEQSDSIRAAEGFLRFIIVGGGPTGVELAGAIAEISRKTLFENFRRIKPENAQIYLVESQSAILRTFSPELIQKSYEYLEEMGVKVILGEQVTNITNEGIFIGEKFFPAFSIIWAAGNEASPLLKTLDVPLDRMKRVIVGPDLSIPGHPDIFVIGDSANAQDKNGNPLPGIASVALQQGQYVADVIKKKVPLEKRRPFCYYDKGSMATIGRGRAVASIHKFNFSGFFAWLAWCLIHIMYLISFRNRIIVMIQWCFSYFSSTRDARLVFHSIDGEKGSILHKVGDHYEDAKGAYQFFFNTGEGSVNWRRKKRKEEEEMVKRAFDHTLSKEESKS